MTKSAFLLTVFMKAAYLLVSEADADSIGSESTLEKGLNYIKEIPKEIAQEIVDPPESQNSSIKYRIYTPRNPSQPCFLKPTQEALQNCPINPKIQTIFLIHGFLTDLNPGNSFEVMKDTLMQREPCNVVLVDWTKYNGPPYVLAIKNVYIVGRDAANLIKFLMKNAGLLTDNITIIGHSLGAVVAGAIGKNLPNIKRIDGLDPAGPYFEIPILHHLSYTDANFVHVIHTSNVLGLEDAIGHMDFYVNGGERQPPCQYGFRFRRTSGDIVTIDSPLMKSTCNHELSIAYYINALNSTGCKFLGTKCNSYQDFNTGKCPPESSEVEEMGFNRQTIAGLLPHSKFYLRTSHKSPYCLPVGYKPLTIVTVLEFLFKWLFNIPLDKSISNI